MVDTEKITAERLSKWSQRLNKSHSTPFCLIGIGHDHVSGEITVCMLEDTANAELAVILLRILEQLKTG